MQHDPFDPAAWLAHWSAAGGGWAGHRLLIPCPDATLKRMVRDLANDEVIALAEHMGGEPVE